MLLYVVEKHSWILLVAFLRRTVGRRRSPEAQRHLVGVSDPCRITLVGIIRNNGSLFVSGGTYLIPVYMEEPRGLVMVALITIGC